MTRVIVSILLVLLGGCGYRFQGPSAAVTMTIPPIQGDVQGSLVTELVQALTKASLIEYVEQGGGFSLEVNLLTDLDERIGFRFDRDPVSGLRRDNIVGTENRRTLSLEVQLVDLNTHKVVFGPQVIQQGVDFDYVDADSIRDLTFMTAQGRAESVLNFSLGQLDSVAGARDDTTELLYRGLARQVVEQLACFFSQDR